MAHTTFDPKRAQELAGQGLSCRAIAKELGCAPSTVSRWAEGAGVVFDRSQTAKAVAAHTVDLAAGRVRLAEKMLAVAEDMLDRLNDPYLVYNFGGKDNDYNEHTLNSAPVEVRRSSVVTAGIAFDKITKHLEKDTAGVSTAHSLLDTLAAGFSAAAAEAREASTDDGE